MEELGIGDQVLECAKLLVRWTQHRQWIALVRQAVPFLITYSFWLV